MSNTDTTSTTSSSWWGMTNNFVSSISQIASDFTESITTENQESIDAIKSKMEETNLTQITSSISDKLVGVQSMFDSMMDSVLMNDDDSGLDPQVIKIRRFEKQENTYLKDGVPSDEFEEFMSRHSDEEWIQKGTNEILISKQNEVVQSFFDRLVPTQVGEATFWKRYYFHRERANNREVILSNLMEEVNTENEDGMDWGNENEEDFGNLEVTRECVVEEVDDEGDLQVQGDEEKKSDVGIEMSEESMNDVTTTEKRSDESSEVIEEVFDEDEKYDGKKDVCVVDEVDDDDDEDVVVGKMDVHESEDGTSVASSNESKKSDGSWSHVRLSGESGKDVLVKGDENVGVVNETANDEEDGWGDWE